MDLGRLNRLNYPLLSAYLETLPGGLDSYPEAKTRSTYSLLLQRQLGAILENEKLPLPLRSKLQEQERVDEWIPATKYAALCALARDRLWTNDVAYFNAMSNLATEMYSTPFYRAVMSMLSPSLIVYGSSKRWHRFHEGTTLTVTSTSKTQVDLVLLFPDYLFTKPALDSLGATFCAAASGAGGRQPEISHRIVKPGCADFAMSWSI